ncbi:Cytochrome P450 [Operophtera brumata]|uniref:unspecific monooxygenase n=1 Tax=Operophtera brumata TaxID=104452 RepID=A0A0L7KN22_OPEBR|nr:Cytochrome P450 [Operophtera brumata]
MYLKACVVKSAASTARQPVYNLPREPVAPPACAHSNRKMITAAILFVVIVLVYYYGTRNFNYWATRGVKYEKPIWLFGNNARGYTLQKSMTQIAVEYYNKYPNERVVGFFRGVQPELVLRDPEIVKRVIQTDFNSFHYRGFNPHKTVIEPLMRNLFFADGDLWRLLRQRMTPAFTSGKLKAMFPLIVERAERLQARTLAAAAAGRTLDARDLMARYTTDFIGACGFGLDADSLNDEDSAFRQLGIKIFQVRVRDAFKAILKEVFPGPFKHFRFLEKVEGDMKELVTGILKQRNYESSGRNDFIDLMLECKKKGIMSAESLTNFKADGTPEIATLELTEELIAAQVFVFFAAGFETSSSATSFTLHQLAYNPHIQQKVQADIDRVLAKHGGKLCYDAVQEMTYLEWTFKEGMRMFPSLGFLFRECARKYKFEDLNFSIDEGVRIMIPLQALHNDPEYFDEPQEFRPERFDPAESGDSKNKFVYLPFGDGPRACIGARLGLMQSLAGLAAVLSQFSVEPAPSSLKHPVVDPRSNIVQSIQNGLPLIFRERTI